MSTLVIEQQANPSTDFFVRPYLTSQDISARYCRLSDSPPSGETTWDRVIFVRYLSARWQRWVMRNREKIGRLVLFLDDDLFDLKAHRGLPWRYRYKLWHSSFRYQTWLKLMQAELWVSTPYLATKYAHWSPVRLSPAIQRYQPQLTLFYHGSASHWQEFIWLYGVLEQVLDREPRLSVELIGNSKVRALFAPLPRVHVLHPMGWPAYQALLSRPGRHIGLAPLLNIPFNAARAGTKFLDITQAGAVGIYANHPAYQPIVRHGKNGLLLSMEPKIWIEAILQLAQDDTLRQRLLLAAQEDAGINLLQNHNNTG